MASQWVYVANLTGPPGDEAALERLTEIDAALAQRPRLTDRQVPQLTAYASDPGYTHAWADNSGRVGLALRKTGGEGVLPGGLDTPRAGTRADAIYSWAVADKEGRVSELAIGPDGLIPAATLAAWAKRMGSTPGASTTTKLAGVALTLADSATPSTSYSDVTVRLPIKLGATASRWRVHIRNYNDKTGTAYPGALAFTGVSVGTHQRDGATAALTGRFEGSPSAVSGPFSSPADGGDWVSGWVEGQPLEAHKDYLLSYGFTGPAAQSNYMASSGGWTSASAGDVNAAALTLTAVRSVPLDVWLEVEVPTSTRVIAYLGDSLTLGIASTLPVYDSWAAKHAVANGAIHSVYAIGGSQYTDWVDVSSRKISKWAGLPKPDAVMLALGNNDIFLGATLETMKSRLLAGINMARTYFNQDVYLATVLPRIGANAGYEQVRKDFNEWMLTTLPGGARMVFDFASAIEADNKTDASLRWASAANNFHLSSAGYARCAATITQRLA